MTTRYESCSLIQGESKKAYILTQVRKSTVEKAKQFLAHKGGPEALRNWKKNTRSERNHVLNKGEMFLMGHATNKLSNRDAS